MKAFIILALAAVSSASMLPTLVNTKNRIATYNKKLTMVGDTSIYDRAWDSEPENFILNGTDAQPGQFPHVARVTIVRPTGTGQCSGSLIATNFALTASHCVNSNPETITSIGLLIGTVNRNVPGTTIQMAEFWCVKVLK
jgi:Trypsin